MFDFTVNFYHYLLKHLLLNKYCFEPFVNNSSSLFSDYSSMVIIRHDVDALPENSLKAAKIENNLGIKGTYFFRIVPQSNVQEKIMQIVALGHEIGYHYEDLALCKGNVDEAIISFEKNLKYFRQYYPVKTICMHGSPLSKYDNRKLWVNYDYRDFGIVAEPYFDVDYKKVLYLTDTGRRWDGEGVSVRDKVRGKVISNRYPVTGNEETDQKTRRPEDQKTKEKWWIGDNWDNGPLDKNRKMVSRDNNGILIHNFHSTFDIIKAVEENRLPNQIMITVHPQRWTSNPLLWTKELVMQNFKNQVKKFIISKQTNDAFNKV